jgi:hypothetical protein
VSKYEAAAAPGLRSPLDGGRDEGATGVDRATREGAAMSGLARANEVAE